MWKQSACMKKYDFEAKQSGFQGKDDLAWLYIKKKTEILCLICRNYVEFLKNVTLKAIICKV